MTQHSAVDLAHLQKMLERALVEADRCDDAVAAHVAMAIARLDEVRLLRQSKAR